MTNPKEEHVVAYICDGHADCSLEPGCYMREEMVGKTDVICHHTTKPDHAKNALCKDPENHPERFACLLDSDQISYYERLPGEEL